MQKKWAVVVYNDEFHTYEEVIHAFTSVLPIDEEVAGTLAALISESSGFAPIAVFSEEEEAQQIAQDLRDITSKENSNRAPAGIQVEVCDEIIPRIEKSTGKTQEAEQDEKNDEFGLGLPDSF